VFGDKIEGQGTKGNDNAYSYDGESRIMKNPIREDKGKVDYLDYGENNKGVEKFAHILMRF
jgi:hypothetical protein